MSDEQAVPPKEWCVQGAGGIQKATTPDEDGLTMAVYDMRTFRKVARALESKK